MTGHRQYKITDFRFGQMVLGLREKIGLTQKEVADALEVSRRTIQHWEAGTAFPDTAHLKSLIAYFLQYKGFSAGAERDEAYALWAQADESAARRRSMFDEPWFRELLQLRATPAQPKFSATQVSLEETAAATARTDWGDAPDVLQIFGREKELSALEQWILHEQCRLVALQGMGGIGKTTIAVKFVQDFAAQFDYVIWRSLRNAPSLEDLLLEFLQILSPVHPSKPTIKLLIELLQQNKCLLILDNVETLHSAGKLSGMYREGYEEYQGLFQSIARSRHKSCLLLTSREMPVELEGSEGMAAPVRVMKVAGLNTPASQAMLTDKGLFGPADAWDVFVHYYTGNPLALKVAAATVRDLFGGDLAAFLREAPVTLHTLNQLLSNQFEHLSPLERDILFWLAIEREPVSLNQLRRNFLVEISNNELLCGLLSLLQRSLIERGDQNAVFFLLPVLLEFVTDRLVNTVVEQLTSRNLEAITKYALIKSQTPDYIRDSQARMIVQPVLAYLKRQFTSQVQLSDHLRMLISEARRLPRDVQGYAGGNLLNLLARLNEGIKGENFSGLVLRQVYIQGVIAQDTDFSRAEFIDSRFTEPLESISAMMMSPSGTFLAASTYNGHIRCWNVADGKPIWTVTNARRAWSIAFSPDESTLACSNFRGQVSLWDVPTGHSLGTLEGHHSWVHTVAFHPDGRRLAGGGDDAVVRVWDLQEKKIIHQLKGHSGRLWSLAFSPDGKLLVSGADDESIHIWDTRSGNLLRVIHHPAKGLKSVAFHPGGKWIASCCEQDPHIRLWNVHTGESFGSLASRSNGPSAIAFNHAGSLLVSGGRDGSVELWHISAGNRPQYIKMLMGHHHLISVIALSQHDLLATLSYGEDIKLWDVASGRLMSVIEGYNRLIGANAFSPDGKLLLLGDSGGRIRAWDIITRRYLATIEGTTGPIWTMAFSPDGKMFATAGDDRLVRLWDAASLQCLKTYPGHSGPIWHLAFNHDGSILASGGSAHWIKLWDTSLEAGTSELGSFESTDDLWSLAFDPLGKTLVSGHTQGSVVIWDAATGKPKATLQHGTVPIGAVRFSSDGKTLITSSNQELLKFWNVETGECERTTGVEVEGNRTKAVVIGKDGHFAATGGSGASVYLWHLQDEGEIPECVSIEGHTNRVWAIALSPDECYLASGDEEGTTLLIDVQAGKVVEKISIDRPYERMNIRGVSGLNAAERAALKALGAVENQP